MNPEKFADELTALLSRHGVGLLAYTGPDHEAFVHIVPAAEDVSVTVDERGTLYCNAADA